MSYVVPAHRTTRAYSCVASIYEGSLSSMPSEIFIEMGAPSRSTLNNAQNNLRTPQMQTEVASMFEQQRNESTQVFAECLNRCHTLHETHTLQQEQAFAKLFQQHVLYDAHSAQSAFSGGQGNNPPSWESDLQVAHVDAGPGRQRVQRVRSKDRALLAVHHAEPAKGLKFASCVHGKVFHVTVAIAVIVQQVACILIAHWALVSSFEAFSEKPSRTIQSKIKRVYIFDEVVSVWFAVEITLRLIADGKTFWKGRRDDVWWNMYDSALVAQSFIMWALVVLNSKWRDLFAFTLVLRLGRVVRLLKLLKAVRGLSKFRRMVYSTLLAMRPLLWVLVIIFGFLLVLSVVIGTGIKFGLQLHVDKNTTNVAEHVANLKVHYNGIPNTMQTLFKAITGGDDWNLFCKPLVDLWAPLGWIFYLCISVMAFGVLNIVTSIFIDEAVSQSSKNPNLLKEKRRQAVKAAEKHETEFRKALEVFFDHADADGSGRLSLDELTGCLQNMKFAVDLDALGLDHNEATNIFHAIVPDAMHEITRAEFCAKVPALCGCAKSLDIAILFKKHYELEKYIRAQFLQLNKALNNCSTHERSDQRDTEATRRKTVTFADSMVG